MAQPQTQAIDILMDIIAKKTNINTRVDKLPLNGGTTIELHGSKNRSRSLNGSHQSETLVLLFLSKNKSQLTAVDNLNDIGNCLSSINKFPDDEIVQIISAMVTTDAGLVENDNDYWIYSMVVDVKIAFKQY